MLKKYLAEDEIVEIAKNCAGILADKKASEITLLDLKPINSYLDYFVIATGNSHIHCTALAKELQKYLKGINFVGIGNPRLDTGWIALDYNEIVIHLFTRDVREYYQLDRLWGDADSISF